MAYLHTEDARRRRTEAVLVGLLHQCWRLGRRVRLGEVPLVGTVDLQGEFTKVRSGTAG